MKTSIRQHQPLRVPNGWKDQDRALVIQLENLFDEVYAITSKLRDTMVTDVGYNETSKYLTQKIGGEILEIIKVATLDADGRIPSSELPTTVGTITSVKMNGSTVATEGEADLGTVIQDVSDKADKSSTVSAVSYDSTNKKITKTINGATTDVVSVATIKSALGSFTWGALAGQ